MRTTHLHVTIQQLPSGKHSATIRSEGHGVPYGLTRAFPQRPDAVRWLLENLKCELAEPAGDTAA